MISEVELDHTWSRKSNFWACLSLSNAVAGVEREAEEVEKMEKQQKQEQKELPRQHTNESD